MGDTTAALDFSRETSKIDLKEIRAKQRQLARRDWMLWVMAILVMLALTAAVAGLALPILLKAEDFSLEFNRGLLVRALFGMVLLVVHPSKTGHCGAGGTRRRGCVVEDLWGRREPAPQSLPGQLLRRFNTGRGEVKTGDTILARCSDFVRQTHTAEA